MKKEISIVNNQLEYNNVNLLKLAKEYGTPLKVTFLDVIKNRVKELKKNFDLAIKEKNYPGEFIYLNANKANYGCLEIEEAFENGDGLECSSYHDLLLTKDIYKKYNNKEKLIVCNGIKPNEYVQEIVQMSNEGYNIITIVDSKDEYLAYKNSNLLKPLNIGIRIHLSSLYSEEHEIIKNDRFGAMDDEFNYIINDVNNCPNLNLTTIHFHQRGFDYEEDKFLMNIKKAFNNYYIPASLKVNTITNFDIGGGTPLPINNTFDYKEWGILLINTINELTNGYKINKPNIISENGKYSQKDSTVNIYKVISIKKTDDIPWYILDGSLLIAMPESYALGEDILIRPINNININLQKARLASITCDCDDIYFDKNTGFMMLPKVDSENELYIALLGTGSYQNSMNGKGGTHHCLLPEETDLVVYTKNDKLIYSVRNPLQDIEKMKEILHFSFKK